MGNLAEKRKYLYDMSLDIEYKAWCKLSDIEPYKKEKK